MVNDHSFVLFFPNVDSLFWTPPLPLPEEPKLHQSGKMGQWKIIVIRTLISLFHLI